MEVHKADDGCRHFLKESLPSSLIMPNGECGQKRGKQKATAGEAFMWS